VNDGFYVTSFSVTTERINWRPKHMWCIELNGKVGAYCLIVLFNYTKVEGLSQTKIIPNIGIKFNY
jgi:hypothetical protein